MNYHRPLKYLLRRSLVVMTMVMLMFISGMSALLLSRYSNAGFLLVWPVLGDFVLPLCFVLLAQIFRNRLCAVIAVLSAFLCVILRITALIIRKETFMPLGLDSVLLLWEHTDHNGLRAVFGRYYLLWGIPLLLLVLSAVIYFCGRVWYASRNKRRIIPDSWITVFAILFVISIAASSVYVFSRRRKVQDDAMASNLVRPVPVVVAELAGDIVDMALEKNDDCGYFPENLPEESAEILYAANIESMKAQGAETAAEPAKYDKIIIIACESLDLDFISAYNSGMPADITPNLDWLFRENISYVNCFSASQPTSWGLTALLMSRLDYRRELNAPGNPSLFSIGRKLGYAGYYFSPVSGLFGNNRKTYMKLFGGTLDHFFFLEELQKKFTAVSKSVWGIADFELFDMVLKVMRAPKFPQRFIAVISTIDIHPPYTVAGKPECRHKYTSPFLNALHSFDCHLGWFIRRIMDDPALYGPRTLIVLTADHSATHGENYLKRENFNPSRIPLIFITPSTEPLKELDYSKYCSSIDVTPTLVRLIGGNIPRSFMGRDLHEKKNCAISRTPGHLMFVHRPGEDKPLVLKLGEKNYDSPEKQAFNDYFNLYYSK
ncbi:MAG: hypothetical protein E7042_08270 [Lentisphaerae bacterium]|nr:hypothetical protein [Lentisphaerota bacterium]